MMQTSSKFLATARDALGRTVVPYLVPMPKIVLLFKIQFGNKNSNLWNFQSDIKVICKIGQTQHQKPPFTQFIGCNFKHGSKTYLCQQGPKLKY
jgi:hypothetical protein